MNIKPPSDYRPDRAAALRKALLAATAALGTSTTIAETTPPRLAGVPPPPPPKEEPEQIIAGEAPIVPIVEVRSSVAQPTESLKPVSETPSTNAVPANVSNKPKKTEQEPPLILGGLMVCPPTEEEIKKAEESTTIQTQQRTPLPEKEGFIVHKVESSDTLWSLAQRNGTTVQAILEANGRVPGGAFEAAGDTLWEGGYLYIPMPSAR